jgi:5-deoxy-D-glucuronate isomerase
LLLGFTFSEPGNWTSWPPHEHAQMLEEMYVYFNMPAPAYGLQLVYNNTEYPELVVPVRDGDAVLMPSGYHPMNGGQETGFVCLSGRARMKVGSEQFELAQYDSAYIPRDREIAAATDSEVDLAEFSSDVEHAYPLQVIRYADLSNVVVPGHSIGFLWAMAAHREQVDRQFGVVNVQPGFNQSGSGLEASRRS